MYKKRVCIHEAGHITMAFLLNLPIESVEITPGEGGKWIGLSRVKLLLGKQTNHNNILVSLSGRIAEEMFYGKIDHQLNPQWWREKWTSAGDFNTAFDTVYKMVSSRDEAVAYVRKAMDEAQQELSKYRKEIEKIAAALEAKERLTGPEVLSIVLN